MRGDRVLEAKIEVLTGLSIRWPRGSARPPEMIAGATRSKIRSAPFIRRERGRAFLRQVGDGYAVDQFVSRAFVKS